MGTYFILSSIFVISLCVIKGLGDARKKVRKSLYSSQAEKLKKTTSIVRVYRFDRMYDPKSFFYRREREILISSLPDDLIKSELAILREQYKAYLDSIS
jgi:hypothetical protein